MFKYHIERHENISKPLSVLQRSGGAFFQIFTLLQQYIKTYAILHKILYFCVFFLNFHG